MDSWSLLGLDGPTGDLKAIKRAYAKKLRVTRPDDDPEGFMALRDALENAKFAAQYHVEEEDYAHQEVVIEPVDTATPEIESSAPAKDIPEPEHGFTPLPEDKLIPDSHRPQKESKDDGDVFDSLDRPAEEIAEDAPQEPEPPYVPPVKKSNVEQVMEELIALYKDPFGRLESRRWEKLLEDPRLDGIDEAIDFEDSFRCYLLDEFGYFDGDESRSNRKGNPPLITTRIGTIIFNKMGWRDTRGRPLYVQDQVDWLRKDLDVINRDKIRSEAAGLSQADLYEDETEEGLPGWSIGAILFGLYIIGKLFNNMFNNGAF